MSTKINEQLIELVNTKGILSKDVTDATFDVFSSFKRILKHVEKILQQRITDERVKIHFRDSGTFEVELKVADDILIFLMYTNALVFDAGHPVWKSSYIKGDHTRATCGMISIYNFLSDSFKYERRNDIGFLIGRLFINREKHFFVEGKKQLGLLFNDFGGPVIDDESITSIIEKAIQYSIDIDPNVPSFDLMKEISVHEVMDYSLISSITSSKRLGFQSENIRPEPQG